MSKHKSPVFKKARRLGFSILESGKEFSKGKKRTYAPGQHGQKRVKRSAYGEQLLEKQKIAATYFVGARYLSNTYQKAKSKLGLTGENLLIRLERRADNIIYRLGLATTRKQARQLVSHGHVYINAKKVTIPSYQVAPGDKITISEEMKKNVKVIEALANNLSTLPFVELDRKTLIGKFLRNPHRSELNADLNEATVVEYYSKH